MPELDRQKALEACRECYSNRHKRILQHCRTCVYGTLVNTIAQAEAENDLYSNENKNDTTKRKDLYPMGEMLKKIEKKMNRVLCIRCRYEVDKENAEKRRNDPEYKQAYMEKYKRNQTK